LRPSVVDYSIFFIDACIIPSKFKGLLKIYCIVEKRDLLGAYISTPTTRYQREER
jgi:hypothetical protein